MKLIVSIAKLSYRAYKDYTSTLELLSRILIKKPKIGHEWYRPPVNFD